LSDLYRSCLVVSASIALSFVLGTIHSFSVFVPQWEGLAGANRANVSLIYSIALVALTLAVLYGYRLFNWLSPSMVFTLVATIGSLGLILSASVSSLGLLYITYGVIFGSANGLGYGYALQLSGQAVVSARGLAMGLVTAFYAVGATVSPIVLTHLIRLGGNELALKSLAMTLFAIAIVSALMPA